MPLAGSQLAGCIPLDEVGAVPSAAAAVPAAGVRLWRNRDFNTFWLGQSLSVLGDSFALIAMPLLVLQATGSVAQMGLVTGTFGVAQLLAGTFPRPYPARAQRLPPTAPAGNRLLLA